uniref:Fibrobacter succinogenes major paralogous domain-containing protein n=1 Tax=uncultured bacterium contig00104 TaxID=1181571 RepID=A0A806KPW9_9BACT|nr:hypothetical protein [uncultured bacterium contig00104]
MKNLIKLSVLAVLPFLGCTDFARENPLDPGSDLYIEVDGSSSSGGGVSSSSGRSSGSSSSSGTSCVNNEEYFCDSRNNKAYKYVTINNQTWMAENLNYVTSNSKCNNNSSSNCITYGSLYNWTDALSACPKGWHLPSKEEWNNLIEFAGGSKSAGTKLKSASGWNNHEGISGNGTDDYYFNALAGGFTVNDVVGGVGYRGIWWTATENNSTTAYYKGMHYDSTGLIEESSVRKATSFLSVRCLKGEVELCNDKQYTPPQTCVDGVIYGTCNGSIYNTTEKFCLDNKITDLCSGKEYESGQICFDNVVYGSCGAETTPYNTETYFCHKNTASYPKCGGSVYDADTHGCDNNVIKIKCGDGLYSSSTHFCFNNTEIIPLCGSSSYNPTTHFCQGETVTAKCGGKEFTAEQTCLNGVVHGFCNGNLYAAETHMCVNGNAVEAKCGGTPYNPTTHYCYNNQTYSLWEWDECGSTEYNAATHLCDERDYKLYKYVIIGSQAWMAENLNYSADRRCYDCETYGGLYSFSGASCPSGWHLPSDDEWTTLTDYIGAVAGAKLKAASFGGTDDFGFAALPGGSGSYTPPTGYYSAISSFNGAGSSGYWWSSTYSGDRAYIRNMYSNSDVVSRNEFSISSESSGGSVGMTRYASTLLSVRCVKD